METEIWKTIKWSKKYQISNLGRLRTNKDMYSHRISDWRIIQGTLNKDGYRFYFLTDNKKVKRFAAHRLVMETFNPIKGMKKLVVNHKNFNRDDNRLKNLEWLTPEDNSKYINPKAKIYEGIEVIINGKKFKSYSEAAKIYGVAPNTIKNWR